MITHACLLGSLNIIMLKVKKLRAGCFLKSRLCHCPVGAIGQWDQKALLCLNGSVRA